MSIQIPCGIRAPLNNGFTIGDPETENGRVFRYFAYRHPDCQDIWFAAEAQSEREVEGLRCMVGVISPVKKRKMPPKPDANIWAIPDYEYKRLVSLEWLFWRDYDAWIQRYGDEDEAEAMKYARGRVIADGR